MNWLAYLDTIIWLIFFIVFLLIEISTFNMVTIWFSGSALINVFLTLIKITDIEAPFGIDKRSWLTPSWQIIIFLVLSILGIIIFFPKLKKWQQRTKIETNVDALIGKTGIVIKQIEDQSTGQIKVENQIWTAITEDKKPAPKGASVTIVSINGVKAIVKIK